MDTRRLKQFGVRHLLIAMTGAALLFAAGAPFFRRLSPTDQLLLGGALTLLALVGGGMLFAMLYFRARAERAAGEIYAQFQLPFVTMRVIAVGALPGILFMALPAYVMSPWWLLYSALMLVVMSVLIGVTQFWWKLNPSSIEACQHGLILAGVRFIGWTEITRYTFSGQPRNQLNVFLKKLDVLNLPVDANSVEALDCILARHLGAPAAAHPAAAAARERREP